MATQDERFVFPVTKLGVAYEDKGVVAPKRGEGVTVATSSVPFGPAGKRKPAVAPLKAVDGKTGGLPEQVERTRTRLGQGLALLARMAGAGKASVNGVLERLPRSGRRLSVQMVQGHDVFMDIVSLPKPAVRFDVDVVDEVGEAHAGGLDVLYALGLLCACSTVSGGDARSTLLSAVEFYEDLADREREMLERVLACPAVDAGDVFARFLRSAAGQSVNEKIRLSAWVRARTQIELPYNAERVRRAIREETDLASLRQRIYDEINDTYVPEVDAAACERVAEWALERNVRLVGGRFSRAFYLDAMLMASSHVMPGQALAKRISAFEKMFAGASLNFRTDGLTPSLEAVGGEAQRIVNLTSKDQVSAAEVEGILRKFTQALRDFESKTLKDLDRIELARRRAIADERRANRGASQIWEGIAQDRAQVKDKVDAAMRMVSDIQTALVEAPSREPSFMVFFQRLFPLDAINMGMVNDLEDPFFGEDDEVHELIRECGHRMYVTPNQRAWLRRCDDWIEALPAYATYEIIPGEGGSYKIRAWVQRGIMEDMYRRHAPDWALNIEAVMDLEHVALAREILAEEMGLTDEAEKIAAKDNPGPGAWAGVREEAIRGLMKEKAQSADIAAVAAVVGASYQNLCGQVARCRQDEDLSRMDALQAVLERDTSPGNLLARARKNAARSKGGLAAACLRMVGANKLKSAADALGPQALKRRRNLPCIHVLTTLGPGETEVNVQNWLEESMSLFAVSRAYGLEDEAQAQANGYRDRLVAVGGRLVAELDLEGDLFRIIQEDGLNPDRAHDREQGILRLLASYPEVAAEATRLALLIDHEEDQGLRPKHPKDASEPRCVLDYIAAHPQLEADAIRKVVDNNHLAADVRDHMRAHNQTRSAASADVVAANADYAKEKESMQRAQARQRVLDSLGLSGEAAGYVRSRLDTDIAMIRARRQLVAERDLSRELTNPLFRYDATGAYKKYNLLYTPSRVDLGADEVESVKDVPKWLGGLDRDAANAGLALYSLYNVAGPTAVASPRLAEFLKVGENFFSRGGVYYLSLAAGANIDALGIGDFEFFRDQWNMRGDRTVLPTGETYGGFCVPKEFSLLYSIIIAAVNPATSEDLLTNFGVPKEAQGAVVADLRRLLRLRLACSDDLEWEARAGQMLDKRYGDYFAALGKAGYIARLPQMATTLDKAGVLAAENEADRRLAFEFTYWVNKKAQGLEEINRVGPFRKVHLIRQLVDAARRGNPEIAPDGKLVGMMGAPYKEGSRKHGMEIPITDVRFSAGARKLEIYAGTAEHHLLKDIDPEGREIILRMFEGWQSPADIRVVGTCTASDLLNHVPGSGLEDVQAEVYRKLRDAGLDDGMIEANCTVYGGDLAQWAGIKDMPETERRALIESVGPMIHLLVIEKRGIFRTYAQAVQGVDFLDLSIPDPELLDLIDDLPRLLYLMRLGRPNSARVFADGTSGGRRRAFSFRYASCKEKVKELFALDDRAVYGGHGLGRTTIDSWRQEMQSERRLAGALYDALVGGTPQEAEAVYARIVASVRRERKAEEAANDQIAARKFGVSTQRYRCLSAAYSRVARGMTLAQLDFGTWLVLGGRYVLNGKVRAEEIETAQANLRQTVAALPRVRVRGRAAVAKFKKAEVEEMIATFVQPAYVPPPEDAYEEMETGIAGSLKAAEEQVSRLEHREERRRQTRRVAALRLRQRAYSAQIDAVEGCVAAGDFDTAYAQAMTELGDPKAGVTQDVFGRFLCWSHGAAHILIADVLPRMAEEDSDLAALIDGALNGGEVDQDAYLMLVSGLAKAAEAASGDLDALEKVAMALELCDVALLVEKTQDVEDAGEMMIELARFYDITLNNHIFDYIPYHYHKQRTAAFECYDRQAKFELAQRRHRWLYTHGRALLAAKTELRDRGTAYQDAWIGDADRDLMAVGLHLTEPEERFWFGYARLRDVSVLRHEGYVLPELFLGLDPGVLKADKRANVVIVYPHGNTTVPVAMEQGAKLARNKKINLMLTPFPTIADTAQPGLKALHAHDGFMYVSRSDYRAALTASGVDEAAAGARARKVDEDGVLIAVSFRRPLTVHGIFFHFTHPLRPEIGGVRVPLIQPIVWEAATHLKCRLPEMLEGSGIAAPPQINWHKATTAQMPEGEALAKIEADLTEFARRHDTIIVKPEKESGGRSAKILPVRVDGQIVQENIQDLAELVYDICKTDNAVIQRVLRSHVRQLYTRAFQEDMVDRFARIGLAAQLDTSPSTPLFSYFRLVLVRGQKGYEITHYITVVSTRGVANVGQGGLLYEYQDKIINPKYRVDLRREMTKSARSSMSAQRKYIRNYWREILDEYLAMHPEFAGRVPMEVGKDLTGFADTDIPFEMGDYMPVMLVDEKDNLAQVFDHKAQEMMPLFDEQGQPTDVKVYDAKGRAVARKDKAGRPLPIPLFDGAGKRIPRFDKYGKRIGALVVYKIEPNPGAGLWRPHNDQLPPERKGEGVYGIFSCLGDRAFAYRKELHKIVGQAGAAPEGDAAGSAGSAYISSGLYDAQGRQAAQKASSVEQAIDRAREELNEPKTE